MKDRKKENQHHAFVKTALHTDFKEDMSYGDYLCLEKILSRLGMFWLRCLVFWAPLYAPANLYF